MYSSAGRADDVRASESKLKSGLSGGEIMSDVMVRGELGPVPIERGSRIPTIVMFFLWKVLKVTIT
jgi:hypothetical protein